jgi:hypothetical protein
MLPPLGKSLTRGLLDPGKIGVEGSKQGGLVAFRRGIDLLQPIKIDLERDLELGFVPPEADAILRGIVAPASIGKVERQFGISCDHRRAGHDGTDRYPPVMGDPADAA